MKNTQYKLVNIKTGETMGLLIGKTPERELVIQTGTTTYKLAITPKNESLYRIDVVTGGAK